MGDAVAVAGAAQPVAEVIQTVQLVRKAVVEGFQAKWEDVSAGWDVCGQVEEKWEDASKDGPVWPEEAVEC